MIALCLCGLGWGTASAPARAATGALLAPAQRAADVTGAGLQIRWGAAVILHKPEWYASAVARAVADSVLQYQSPAGGWPKNTDLATPPPSAESLAETNTIDNDATTSPMRFLALMVHATGEARYRKAFERGLDYLLAAQYSNGGWPQYFPLREGYYSHITYNDNAMVNVLTVLRDAAALSEIEHERRNGYSYYGTWPASLLVQDYPRWRIRQKLR